MFIKSYSYTVLLATVWAWSAVSAYAQAYPVRALRLVVPSAPGGGTDIVGRALAAKLSATIGQQVVVDNRAGAGTTIGIDVVAKSAPDGYTVLVSPSTLAINLWMYAKLPYDALRDFVGVSPIARVVSVLSVHPSLPPRSVKEFIALAKKRPNEILHGHSGQGSFTHLNGLMFESRAGLRMIHVPFKGGGPAVIALVSGETQAQVAGISELIAYIKVNRVRALGVTSAQRVAQLPDVPTIADTLPGYESSTWVNVMAPAATPKAIVDRLNAEIGKAVKDPDTVSKLNLQTLDPAHRSPDELAQRLRADYEAIGKLFRSIGLDKI